MYVDAPTIACLLDEFNETIVTGRVQQTLEVGPLAVGFEVYGNRRRHYLLISADPKQARCLLTPDKLRRGQDKPSPLGLLLRKYVKGATLVTVRQPPWERIIEFDFVGEEGDTTLIVELMGKRSNIILTVGGDVLDSIKRVKAAQNRYRVTQPGHKYIPPPPQQKTAPETVTLDAIGSYLAEAKDGPAWRALVNNIAGMSPLFAREIVFRAGHDAEAPAASVKPTDVYDVFADILADFEGGQWLVNVAPAPERDGYKAFAPYALSFLEETQSVSTISEAMALYFGAPVGIETYDRAKETVRVQLDGALDRLRGKLFSLDRQQVDQEKIEEYRKMGELVLAYAPTLPPGTSTIEAQYDIDGPLFKITIDPELTSGENAKKYFDKYEKAKSAAANLPKLVAKAKWEVFYLEQISTDLDLAESWPEIDEVREALQKGGYWRGRHIMAPRGGRPGIRRFTLGDGFVVFVGRNAQQNQKLISERSNGNDLWLHARGVPGSHVLIKDDGRPIPDDVIEQAARMAAFYSSLRNDGRVEVDVTRRRYVRPIKGAGPGMVTYRNEETLLVKPSKN